MSIPEEERQAAKAALESAGCYAGAISGGPKKMRYWKPCGCEVITTPSWREYVLRDKNGKVVGDGTRDANYDKGWLPTPPQAKKLCCTHCDEWHDTPEEIEACGAKRAALIQKSYTQAVKEHGTPKPREQASDRLDRLEQSVAQLTGMMKQFMEVMSGKVLQQQTDDRQDTCGSAEDRQRPEGEVQQGGAG